MISPRRYQELGGGASSSMLVPVHPEFRVIATGVPTPPYPGRTLDPPIRSRFQIQDDLLAPRERSLGEF